MDASEFNRLLNTDHYAPADLELVKDVCKNYPAFGLSHMLRVRIMEALSHENEVELKRAAVCAPDRSRLYEMVKESRGKDETGDEAGEEEESSGISFTMESSEEVDVIIDQHAPYVAPATPLAEDDNLLELDEEDSFVLDDEEKAADDEESVDENESTGSGEDSEEELSSEKLIEAVGRNEAEIEEALSEEPDTEHERTPVIDEPENDETEDETSVAGDPSTRPYPEQNSLIRNFIRDEPGPIRADKETTIKGDVSLASIREHDGFITDTLAQIYVKQRLFAKAIYAYEKLSLKYPEKSAYFAAQIEKIRNINHS